MQLLQTATITAFAAAGLVLGGCGMQGGQQLVKLTKDEAETLSEDGKMTEAPRDGNVRLYGSSDITANIMYRIEQGDEVGFRAEGQNDQRRIIAVAGDNETTISQGTIFDRTYYWKLEDND